MDAQCSTNHLVGGAPHSADEIEIRFDPHHGLCVSGGSMHLIAPTESANATDVVNVTGENIDDDIDGLSPVSLAHATALVSKKRAKWVKPRDTLALTTDKIVDVVGSDDQPKQPCRFNKAKHLVAIGRARWVAVRESIALLTKHKWWNETVLVAAIRSGCKLSFHYPAENRRMELVIATKKQSQTETEELVRPTIWHKAGRNGEPGFYSCKFSEFIFLAETGFLELREGKWWVVACPRKYNFLKF
jgi:hypothetical protein